MNRDLILIGGGHTHVLVIKSLAMRPIAGVRLTLISEQTLTPYSGMLPGFVAGHYSLEETHIDLNRLCRWANVRWIPARATGIDPQRRRITMGDRSLEYDKLSIDIGSTPDLSVPGAAEHSIGVKPVSHFNRVWDDLLKVSQRNDRGQWGVIGAGAGGVEMVLAMAHRLREDKSVHFHLVFRGSRILNGYPDRLVARAERALQEHGVQLHPNFTVSRVMADGLQSSDGRVLALDQTISCTGAVAAPWLRETGLSLSDRGFIAVNPYLQSSNHNDIFAVGDCADMLHDQRPKAGVYAVRQAPFLVENLRAVFNGSPLSRVRLQKDFLSLLSLGNRQAVGSRNGFTAHGKWVWKLKDHIDRKFMRRLNEPAADTGMAMVMPAALSDSDMHCAGCGSKLGPDVIVNSLSEIEHYPRDEVIPALGKAEDATVWTVDTGKVAVQSIDGFRSFSSDLYRFGIICANHALSDLYAMGAEPVSAQVWVNLAFAHPRIHKRDHLLIMSGIARALRQQCVALAGGHSTEGTETHVALVANGQANVERLWKKNTVKKGDAIVLTKAIGTGVILAADMQAKANADSVEAAFDSMVQSNREAAELLSDSHPSAVTDVTGFGLLGHLLEMVSGSGLTASIRTSSIPVLSGAHELAGQGIRSSLYPQLLPYTLQCDIEHTIDKGLVDLLIDPQTSGGLLVTLPPAEAERLCSKIGSAIVIGEVLESGAQENKRPVTLLN